MNRREKRRAVRGAQKQAPDPREASLASYFEAIGSVSLLDRAQELELAREIHRLVIEHWRVLLTYRPALSTVALAVEQCMPGRSGALAKLDQPARKLRANSKRTRRDQPASPELTVARMLRRHDSSGVTLRTARNAVVSAFAADPEARTYLRRIARAHAAERAAKSRFVTANLRLVVSMANRSAHNLLPLADLVQEGNVGLMRAVEGFDHRRGFRFSTYATWWIRQSIRRAVADKGRLVRVPVHTLDDLSRIARASSPIVARTGMAPDPRELALLTGVPPEKVAALSAEGMMKPPVSFDRSVNAEGDRTLHDSLPNPADRTLDEELDLTRWRNEIDRLLAHLTPIEATTLCLRFGLNGDECTLREVGEKYNLSRERIRQIQGEALAKLRVLIAREGGESELAA